MNIENMLDTLVGKEGGYSNHPDDPGGETMWGITHAVALAFGYGGEMKDLSQDKARQIYRELYWTQPKFDQVAAISVAIAEELLDTGVNMGTGVAARYLQRALNVLNKQARDFPEIVVDGNLGRMSLAALQAFFKARGASAERIMLRMLNGQQIVGYIERAEKNPRLEEFVAGWADNRVSMS